MKELVLTIRKKGCSCYSETLPNTIDLSIQQENIVLDAEAYRKVYTYMRQIEAVISQVE